MPFATTQRSLRRIWVNRLRLIPLGLVALGLAAACTSPINTAPRLTESAFSEAEIKVAREAERTFVNAQNRVAQETLATLVKAQKEPKPIFLAHDSLLRVLGALLRASDGETYKRLSETLQIPAEDDLTYHVVLRRRLADLNQIPDYQHGAGIWMVWPVTPVSGYVNEMAKYLEVDVYRLGSARVGARRELERWAQTRDTAFPSPFASLGAQDAIIAAALAQVTVGDARSTKDTEFGVADGGTDLQWVFSRQPLSGPLPTLEAQDQTYAVPWPPTQTLDFDLASNANTIGWGYLLEDNDFRGINQELNRHSTVDGLKSVVVGNWKAGTGPGTFAYLIHKPTQAIIAAGYLPPR